MANRRGSARREAAWVTAIVGAMVGVAVFATVPTTLVDYFGPGTQPTEINDYMMGADECRLCHGNFDIVEEPYRPWAATMMGQAARDPIFHAALAIAEQDAAFSGDLCLRCHAPAGWVEGRSVPTNGSALVGTDLEGVTCHTCHRMVDPEYVPGVSPIEDQAILAGLTTGAPQSAHSGHYVIDPSDRRRGPFNVAPLTVHQWIQSPFHTKSQMCATCHDVSNPVFTRQANGTYAFNELNAEHPTDDKYDQFPIERTFSEWSKSAFAQGPINMGGLFGGNKPAVSTCQDCHMPDATGKGCSFGPTRNDLPTHHFNGGNTWVLKAVRALYPDIETHLTATTVQQSIDRAKGMLQNASHLSLTEPTAGTLNVRITNNTGHKLPTGYPEGRRMWINVKYFNAAGALIGERGAYNTATAALTTADTKVYEAKLGLDAAMAQLSGVPQGESFHFVLNNVWLKDNRIPPMGFTNAGFAQVQAAPVGYAYADGQHWDDTPYASPAGARRADVAVYYQTTAKEYIEFLRDANTTNAAGQVAYDQWVLHGRSEPSLMDQGTIDLCYADCNRDGVLSVSDFGCFQGKYVLGDPYADCNGSGSYTVADFGCFQSKYVIGCP
ncbi:MAG: hypothetical protein ACKVU4_11770 [Phycisphaerales bacterium]